MRCAEGLDSKHVASRSSQFSSQSQESTTVGHAVRLGDPDSGGQTRGTATRYSMVLDDKRDVCDPWVLGPPQGHWIKLASLAL